jgi:hypothetical protein
VPRACEIDCITWSESRSGERDVSCIGGSDAQGGRWKMAPGELIGRIESGAITCYVTIEGHAHLVMVRMTSGGEKALHTLLGDLETLLRLPPCP